ncbi:MAG: CBS domain-containing protein [Bdellovibrionales bacterium]
MQTQSIEKRNGNLKYSPTVRDLMTPEVFTLNEEDSFNMVDTMMKWRRIRHVPVVDEYGALVGLVTHRDFLKVAVSRLSEADPVELKKAYKNIKVKEIMQPDVLAAPPTLPIAEAAQLMHENKFGCLPVVEEGKLVGIITEADFVRAFFDWEVKFTDED